MAQTFLREPRKAMPPLQLFHFGPVVENKAWDAAETLPRPQMESLQLARIKETIERVENVPFYKAAFAKERITPEMVRSLEDLRRLPITDKNDLRERYPLGFLAVPREKVARIHASSGITGKPTFVAYTRDDLKTWADLCARFLTAGGLRPEHTVHVAFNYGLFTGGFGLHYGIERVGAAIVPVSSGNSERQIALLKDLKTDALVCTPSYAFHLGKIARDMGLAPGDLALQFAYLGGEPWTEEMRKAIEQLLGLHAFNNYGLSEVIGPGISGECCMKSGMHIQEDHFIVECLNPDTLEPVKEGEQGEMVFTSLTKQAMPIIRYRTHDISTLLTAPCPCGRTSVRMGRVVGRTDDMLIVRGVKVFPSQIEKALLRIEEIAPHFQIEVTRPQDLDEVTVRVEMHPKVFSDMMIKMHALRERIAREIKNVINIRVNVELADPNTLERFQGKVRRVLDKRNKA